MSTLQAIPVFVKVAERESFSAAARELGVSKSFVSKTVRGLEDHLGVRLLNRSTRQVVLTHEGADYLARCQRVLADLVDAERALTEHQSAPVGLLKLTIPMSLGTSFLGDALADFLALHPGVELDVELSDRRADLLEENFDLAIRVGELADSALMARKLASTTRYVLASPEYVARRGEPSTPKDLERHPCLLYGYQSDGASWRLQRNGEQAVVRVTGPVTANNGELLCQMAIRGHGVALLPDFIAHEAIRDGALVPLLRPWCRSNAGVWAVFPHRRHLTARVRALVDFLAERFQPQPPWQLEDEPAKEAE